VGTRTGGTGEPIQEKIVNRTGFRVDDENGGAIEYLILPEVFRREICEGFDYRAAAKALEARELLETQPPHLTKKCRLPEVGNVQVFAVRSSILES
jgi:hypothetical protein